MARYSIFSFPYRIRMFGLCTKMRIFLQEESIA